MTNASDIINEAIRHALQEDVTWSKNDNGGIDMTIGQSKLDKDNIGLNKVDTRVFGTKNDVLNGDGTRTRGGGSSVGEKNDQRADMIRLYSDTITWIENGRNGEFNVDEYNLPRKTRTAWIANIKTRHFRMAKQSHGATKHSTLQHGS